MAERTKLWYLQNFNLFSTMGMKAMEELSGKTHMKSSGKKEIIFFPEEPSETLYFLKEGKIKITRVSEDGKSTTLQLLGPGEIFGESSILGQDTHQNLAEVLEDAVICTISRDMFQEMLRMNPDLNMSINKFIGWRMRRIENQLEDLVFKTAQERIESFLRRYVKSFGKEMADGWRVRPFLTHQEIAELTATVRQTVNVVLNELAEKNTIKFSRRFMQVLDENWLNKL
ncbi:MAG: Crp/Fnr family transcriptional regulator [Candidatus Marinimicrobia bacterium]|jgi:CRP/FNR family transcriptional regulator|nr:Crp/Fnr family transcriptional regulator [Candidatus Neomarinimicrobiota bacterium]MBT4753764.1 Crp/Fnr family transcriptional regulator [Candidatus Neomarinimicrobiota bacterium]MBT5747868.1 Crp/Fnr family transcriptional regulator [Candidatus Neomarinimicrobiota bacterium]MBT6414261.1 Crp/Fnr family transcriptional regulator [Candidatus Neomarinimicrobiota bacterium]MBT6796578.1 Crp/Fnr family transcriptional regulator [Candidatus Neomarinimicrobiota bacterium]